MESFLFKLIVLIVVAVVAFWAADKTEPPISTVLKVVIAVLVVVSLIKYLN